MNKIIEKLVAMARLALIVLGVVLIPFSCSVSALASENTNATGGWYSTKPLQNTASATADGNTYSIEPLPRRVGDKAPYDPATAVAPHPDAEPFSVVRVDANPRLQCLQYNGRINLGIIQIVWGEHECTPDP